MSANIPTSMLQESMVESPPDTPSVVASGVRFAGLTGAEIGQREM